VSPSASLRRGAVAVRALTRRFGESIAVDALTFDVAAGEILGLVGPDGAGKTTTLRMLAGVLPPSGGSFAIGEIGYLAQRFSLYGDLSVRENVRFFGDVFGVDSRLRDERAGELLAMADLARFQERLADQLSGGMKQKLALTCALLHRPDVLLLDEPTAGVDPVSRRDLWRILYRLQEQGLTIVLSTAYMDEAERCHRVLLLSAGRSVALGTPDELRARLPGAIVEVVLRESTPTALRVARDAALRTPGARGAQLFGDRLHVAIDSVDLIGGLVAALPMAVARAEPVEPTLEDVFLALRR
jgi:ABC-2 type transport system ATP-binding protein